jgi:flagellar hook-associated protein 2
MATISSLGIGSGLDVQGLVDQLVSAERAPAESRLNILQAELQTELSAFGSLKGNLSSLDGALATLSGVEAGRGVSSSDGSKITASVGGEPDEGVYTIEVGNLARAQSLASEAFTDPTDTVGTGTLTLTVGGDSESATEIVIDADNNTIEGVRDAINAADAGARASIVDDGSGYRLLITAEQTGLANAVEISVVDDDGSLVDGGGLSVLAYDGANQNMSQTAAPLDASLTVNGLPISSTSNVLTDVVSGLNITLKAETTDGPVTLTVSEDLSPVSAALSGFVSAYNALSGLIDETTAYDPESGSAGVLLGDSLTRGLESQLRIGLSGSYGESGAAYRALIDLGVGTNDEGRLEIDDEALNAALEADPAGVVALLQGLGGALKTTVADYLGDSGLIAGREETLESGLEGIADDRTRLDERVAVLEARYLQQFTALDLLISELQATSEFLTTQLANLPKPGDFGRGSD